MHDLAPVLDRIEADFEASVQRLEAFLRFASVGADPAFRAQTRACADWLSAELAGLGMASAAHLTPGQPIVLAHDDTAPSGAPMLLYYGHYDVQPADPVELWTSPPFEPRREAGAHGQRVVARGAVDDKGQVLTWVEAMRAWKAVHGALPVRATMLVEGEEESSGESLEPFILANLERLRAEACIISDTNMLGIDRPAITTRLRGMVYIEVTLHGPDKDLHSGMYGGAVVNPLNALVRLLAGLHDDQGRVTLPGFYDRVAPVSAEECQGWAASGFDEAAFLAGAGLGRSTGEAGYGVIERVWARPALDLNGIWGGYTGEGGKTVIAAHASAKLSCRLVPDQDPHEVYAALRQALIERAPAGCRVEVKEMGLAPAIAVPTRSPWLDAAGLGIADAFGVAPVLIGTGGSIPVVATIKRCLGIDSLLVGFGLDDDRVHSPNEKFDLACYRQGIRTHAAMLARFAAVTERRRP